MATTCKVYLSDGLPIEVRNAHRAVYFPDGSLHILDKSDRPVFIGAPGRYVGVNMEYALDENPEQKQTAAGVPAKNLPAVIPVQPHAQQNSPQAAPEPQWEKVDTLPRGFPPVGDSKPAEHPEPGEVRITSLQQRGPDGETTHEIKIPYQETDHRDFLRAPQTAGQ